MAWQRTREDSKRGKRRGGVPWRCPICTNVFKGGGPGARASHYRSKHPGIPVPGQEGVRS
jgi:hypothetical protein